MVGGDAAVGVEGARGGRAAHGELGDVRRGGVQGAGRRHRHVPVEADASVGEAGQRRAVFLADGHQGVLDLEMARRALQLGPTKLVAVRLLTVRSAVGATPPLFCRAVTRSSMVRGAHAAVDGRDRAAERVEDPVALREGLSHEVPGVQRREVGGGDVAAVRLALRPTVAVDLQRRQVAQHVGSGQR